MLIATRSIIPDKGIGSSEYMDYLYTLLDDADVLIAIVNEINKLADDEILFKLSRAEESGKTGCYIGVVAISNKIEYYENLDERVKSSFQDDELVFHPYDAGQIREILSRRRDAFRSDVLEDDVILRVAALAAREHGDARKAIEIFRVLESWLHGMAILLLQRTMSMQHRIMQKYHGFQESYSVGRCVCEHPRKEHPDRHRSTPANTCQAHSRTQS